MSSPTYTETWNALVEKARAEGVKNPTAFVAKKYPTLHLMMLKEANPQKSAEAIRREHAIPDAPARGRFLGSSAVFAGIHC